MARVISTINLKGGVGKTTTTVALAEMLSAEFGKKVLVIDLDPQTNATVMLIGEDNWKNLNDQQRTLARLFQDALVDPADRQFDLESTIQRGVSNVQEVRTVDLLPSSLDLIDVQDRLASMPSGKFYAANPVDVLRRAAKPILDKYDYVFIDCPPNLGIITLNGLRISDGYLIPTIPDILSTYGIPQIIKRVRDFAREIGERIEPYGIVISMYRAQLKLHQNTLRWLRANGDVRVFETVIPHCGRIAEAAEFLPFNTLRQKYGYQGQFEIFRQLTEEVLRVAV
ncbi:MAG: AAA family ATPase [Bryobacteraceae bacterium]|nr:AAA family ATPase [Bryobacteraceae bacterium]MDW8380381.1 AAA family ATPase [Bryobacterales bacterium]